MQSSWDVAVLGAGPAGGEAARAASERGLNVLLIDEQVRPGGQVWRAKGVQCQGISPTVEARRGDSHRRLLEDSAVTFLGAARLWHIERQGDDWHMHILVNGLSERHVARSVILAPGAREFVQPFPGWTRPGVYGLAGVTALMKSQQIPPGRRAVVAGGGPLAVFAATEILRLGGQVAALVVPNSRGDWLKCLPLILLNPAMATKGAEMMLRLKHAGVPMLWQHVVTQATGNPALQTVHVSPCDTSWAPNGPEQELAADALCVGHGLVPNTDAAALAGVKVTCDEPLGVWIPETGPCGQTALPGLFVCGDGAVLRGAETACRSGKQVGIAAASVLEGQALQTDAVRRPHRSERFGEAMTRLGAARPGLLELTTGDTTVCRCENLTRKRLDAAIDAGATSLDALKSATRCGMGPCGGRYCMTAAARLVANQTGVSPASISPPTPRPPLFPLPASAVATAFEYDELPIPEPAPL